MQDQLLNLTIRRWFMLDHVEIFILRIVGMLVAINAGLLLFRGGAVDAQAYITLFVVAVAMAAIGQFYRVSGRSLAAGDAFTYTALMILFSNSALVFNYLLLPLSGASIDPFLMQLDAWFGYTWPAAVAFAGDHPWINEITRYAYLSTMPQVTLLIVLLGLMGRKIWLQRLLLMIVTTTIVLICFWAIFPSHGPSAFYALSPEVVEVARPIVGSQYGERLLQMMIAGPKVVTPSDVEGLIAFPSYHTTLAFICAFCAFAIRWLIAPMLLLNMAILPGTLFHGGHHLVDIFAGFALFLFGMWAANRLIRTKQPA